MARSIAFGWEFNKTGYDFTEVQGNSNLLKKQPVKETTYQVHMQNGALFQTFAEVEPTEKGVKDFANQYGLLGISEPLKFDGKLVKGEALTAWVHHITQMRRLTILWNRAKAGDTEWLSKNIYMPSFSNIISYAEPVGGVNPLMHLHSLNSITVGEVEPLEPGDLIKPARALVARMVNRHLKQSVSPTLFFQSEDNDGQGEILLRFLPSTLLGAMWLQFAQAVAQDDRFFTCEVCGSWFVAKRMQGSKPARHYCSNACSQKAYRARKGETENA